MIFTRRRALRPISGLLFGCCFLTAANTLTHATLSVVMRQRELNPALLGLVMSLFSLGVMLGSRYAHVFIHRVGHVRAFAGLCALIGVTMIMHSVSYHPWSWALLRVLHGIGSAAAYIALESWLNAFAQTHNRGRLIGIYQTLVFIGASLAPLLLAWYSEVLYALSLAAMLVMLGLIPMTLSRKRAPDLEPFHRLSVHRLFVLSPTGATGALVGGILYNSVLFLLPGYATQLGFSPWQLAIFISALTMGGLLLQYPCGRIADRIDKRLVLILISAGLVLFSLGFYGAQLTRLDFPLLAITILLLGGCTSCIYPLSMSETFGRADASLSVPITGTLLLVFATGSIIGPILFGVMMYLWGEEMLFFGISGVSVVWMAFLVVRMHSRSVPPEGRQRSMEITFQGLLSPLSAQWEQRDAKEYSEINWVSIEARIAAEIAKVNAEKAPEIARAVIQSVLNNKLKNEFDSQIVTQIAAEVAKQAPERSGEIVSMLAETIDQHHLDHGETLINEIAARVAGSIQAGADELIDELATLDLVDGLHVLGLLARNKPQLATSLALHVVDARPHAVREVVEAVLPGLSEHDTLFCQKFLRAMMSKTDDRTTLRVLTEMLLKLPISELLQRTAEQPATSSGKVDG